MLQNVWVEFSYERDLNQIPQISLHHSNVFVASWIQLVTEMRSDGAVGLLTFTHSSLILLDQEEDEG